MDMALLRNNFFLHKLQVNYQAIKSAFLYFGSFIILLSVTLNIWTKVLIYGHIISVFLNIYLTLTFKLNI